MTDHSPNPAALAKHVAASAKKSGARSVQGAEDACGDFGIRIARDGTWFYHGSPIGRKSLCKLFASVLQRDADGAYWLVTPAEKGRIVVEDAPFVAVEVTTSGTGREQTLTMRTNLDDTVKVDSAHPIRVEENSETGEPAPYVTVRDDLEARIHRPVFYELVSLGEERPSEGGAELGVWSAGTFFPLGQLTGAS